MKALSGYVEWFWLMAKNWKDVENRSWPLPPKLRGPLSQRIYLHASKGRASSHDISFIHSRLTAAQLEEFIAVDWSKYRGRIIGEITIVGQITRDDPGPYSPWFFGPYGFVVGDGQLYDSPIPYKGRLGFFEVEV